MPPKSAPRSLKDMFVFLGEDGVKELGYKMYSRVWKDNDNPWFSGQFVRSAPFDHAARQLVLFVGQQVGGGDMWGGFRQEPKNIVNIHKNFVCGPKSKDHWLMHMIDAIDEMGLTPHGAEAKDILMKWFDAFAQSVVNCDLELELTYIAWTEYFMRVENMKMEEATMRAREKALADPKTKPVIPEGTQALPVQHVGEPKFEGPKSIVTKGAAGTGAMTARFDRDQVLNKYGVKVEAKSTQEAFNQLCNQLEKKVKN